MLKSFSLSLSLSLNRLTDENVHTTPTSFSKGKTSHKFLLRQKRAFLCTSQKISIPFIYNHNTRNIKNGFYRAFLRRCVLVSSFLFYTARELKRFSSNRWGFVQSRGPLREAFPIFFFPSVLCADGLERPRVIERRNWIFYIRKDDEKIERTEDET